MLQSVNLRDYMLLHPVRVKAESNMMEAMRVIIDNKISGVCVVDDADNLVGILSELDCLRAIVDTAYNDNEPYGSKVEDLMTRQVDVNHVDEDIVGVASQMLDKRQRRRPIVENGKLVGQVTCRQILKAAKDFLGPEDPTER